MEAIQVFKIETFGAVDGPGVRLVIFTQGCNFRCKYCHNPESWDMSNQEAKLMTVENIINLFERNRPFYGNGGITISGGEPMLHPLFLISLANECKKRKIHLAIDTSASTFPQDQIIYDKLIDLIDLWIVDVKATNSIDHKYITGCDKTTGMDFIKYLEKHHKPYWIRQVIIKGFNDSHKSLDELVDFMKPLKTLKRYELLSYHTLGVSKYNILNIEYPLKDTQVLSNKEFDEINKYVDKQMEGK